VFPPKHFLKILWKFDYFARKYIRKWEWVFFSVNTDTNTAVSKHSSDVFVQIHQRYNFAVICCWSQITGLEFVWFMAKMCFVLFIIYLWILDFIISIFFVVMYEVFLISKTIYCIICSLCFTVLKPSQLPCIIVRTWL